MEETFTQLEQQLIDAVFDSLQNHIYSNAVFLAERLVAEKSCEETKSILAECYIAEMKPYKAYYVLKDCKSDQNRYKFALTCFKLNKLKEAEKALSAPLYESSNSKYLFNYSVSPENVPNGAYGLYLLGLINERLQKYTDAKEYYGKALELNPTLWIAYEKLCKLGESALPEKIFTESKLKRWETNRRTNVSGFLAQGFSMFPSGNFSSSRSFTKPDFAEEGSATQQRQPSVNDILQQENGSMVGLFGGTGTPNSAYGSHHSKSKSLVQKNLFNAGNPNPGFIRSFPHGEDSAARSSMNFQHENSPGYSVSYTQQQQQQTQQHRGATNQSIGSAIFNANTKRSNVAPTRTPSDQAASSNNNQIKDIMTLLKRLGEPFNQMSSYFCQNAIELFYRLPNQQYKTGWVLSNIGRCYWECVKYSEAEKYFEEAFRIEPYRLEGIEYYSSCLWHMKKEVALCHLAYSALEKSTFAPESWIALGNCYSLQKEHENALKFFNRAIQLNPAHAYAHTLCGHEYAYNEDFQKAKKCFENALSIDLRHYHAWWGLGNIFFRQEKYDRAVDHFQKAISINQRNPVLYTYLGVTLTAKEQYQEALKYFQQSEIIDDKYVLNRYQKAMVLMKLEKYEVALAELEQLRIMNPKEAPIPQLMGKIYKMMNKIDKAHHFLSIALELDSKDAQRIKGMMESLHSNNEFNEDNDI